MKRAKLQLDIYTREKGRREINKWKKEKGKKKGGRLEIGSRKSSAYVFRGRVRNIVSRGISTGLGERETRKKRHAGGIGGAENEWTW